MYVSYVATSTVDFILVVMCGLLHDGELQLCISLSLNAICCEATN